MKNTELTIEQKVRELSRSQDIDKCVDLNYMVYNYGRFHNNKINQIIHLIFVPIIIYTWYVMMCDWWPEVKLGFDVPIFGDSIGAGFWLNFIVSVGYFFCDFKIGLSVAAWYWPAMILGNWTWQTYVNEPHPFGLDQFWFMNWLNIFSWAAQFLGHALFEKRAPALFSNLGFATLAPFFITFEVMNELFGVHESENMVKLREFIEQDIQEFHEGGKGDEFHGVGKNKVC